MLPMRTRLQSLYARLPEAWRWSLPVWAGTRLMLAGWGWLLWTLRLIPLHAPHEYYYEIAPILSGAAAPLLGIWLRWDAVNYLRVALFGYHKVSLTAFFPLYPLLGQVTGPLFGGNLLLALMVISNVFLLIVLAQLYVITQEDFSAETARWTVLLLAVFPGAFFFYPAYPHALTFCLVLASYQAARRERWALALLLGIVAGLAHPTSYPLVVLLGWMAVRAWWKQRSWLRLPLLAVPLGPFMGTALFFAWRETLALPSYLELGNKVWWVYVIWPWQLFGELYKFVHSLNISVWTIGWANILALTLLVALLPFAWRKIRPELLAYQIAGTLYFATITTPDEPMVGFARYALILFPLYMELALYYGKRSGKVAIFFAAAQLLLAGVFFVWGWVG